MKNTQLPLYARLAFILVIIMAAGYICVVGEKIIVPLLFSFLFAILLLPLANYLERKAKFSRILSSLVSVVLFVSVISLVMYILGVQITKLSSEWPLLKQQIATLVHNLQTSVANTFHVNMKKQAAYINNSTANLLNSSTDILAKTVVSVSSTILFLVFILVYTILFLFCRRILMRFIVALCTEEYIDVIYDILTNIKHIIRKYILGLFLEMGIVSSMACLIFWILDIKYMFLLGLLVGILNVVPYIGIFTALLISILITFATTDGQHAVFVAIAIICIHLFDSNFLLPKIVGSQVKLNPLIVILGVIIGEMLFGISGMFLSIPYLAIAKVMFDRIETMEPWGILLGEEEHAPKHVKNLVEDIDKKESKKK